MEMDVDMGAVRALRNSLNFLPSESEFLKDRKANNKFAKASGLYVRGLESRIRMLESQIRDIQLQIGLRKQEEVELYVPSSSLLTWSPYLLGLGPRRPWTVHVIHLAPWNQWR